MVGSLLAMATWLHSKPGLQTNHSTRPLAVRPTPSPTGVVALPGYIRWPSAYPFPLVAPALKWLSYVRPPPPFTAAQVIATVPFAISMPLSESISCCCSTSLHWAVRSSSQLTSRTLSDCSMHHPQTCLLHLFQPDSQIWYTHKADERSRIMQGFAFHIIALYRYKETGCKI